MTSTNIFVSYSLHNLPKNQSVLNYRSDFTNFFVYKMSELLALVEAEQFLSENLSL